MSLGYMEIGLILAVIIILFGGKKLPELGSGIGAAIANFKKSYKDGQAIDVTPNAEKEKSAANNNEAKKS